MDVFISKSGLLCVDYHHAAKRAGRKNAPRVAWLMTA